MTAPTTRRRWTRVTEATLAVDYREAINTRPREGRPVGWYFRHIAQISRDLDAIIGKRPPRVLNPQPDDRPWPPTWLTTRTNEGNDR